MDNEYHLWIYDISQPDTSYIHDHVPTSIPLFLEKLSQWKPRSFRTAEICDPSNGREFKPVRWWWFQALILPAWDGRPWGGAKTCSKWPRVNCSMQVPVVGWARCLLVKWSGDVWKNLEESGENIWKSNYNTACWFGCHQFLIFPFSWELRVSNHPNWLSYFSGGSNHQPVQ